MLALALAPRLSVQRPLPRARLEKLGAGDNWLLLETIRVVVNGITITIPAGFVTDLASVPKWLHWLVDEDELGDIAPILHDWLYRHGGRLPPELASRYRIWTKAEADQLLETIAIMDGAKPWKARVAWVGVKVGGVRSWKDA